MMEGFQRELLSFFFSNILKKKEEKNWENVTS